ncbi:hypothetical protein BH18ACT1_BH18ACT1_13260 [soil metagenome]
MSGLTQRQRRGLVAVLTVAAVARVAWALYATRAPIAPAVSGDPFFYFTYGKDLAAGDGYINVATGDPTAYYPIGYPAVLAALFWVVRHTPIPDDLPLAGSLLNVVLGTASVGLVFVSARRIFDTRVALVGAGIAAVFPNPVLYVATMQLETTFTFLVLAATALVVTHDWSSGLPSRARLLAFGAVLGLSALVRPFSVPFLLALSVAVFATGRGWRAALSALGWSALVLGVVVTPWVVRNQIALGAPVFTTNMGDTLCIDRYVGSNGRFTFVGQQGCTSLPGLEGGNFPDDFEVRSNNHNIRQAVEFVVEHPGEEARLVLLRARLMFESDSDGLTAVQGAGADPFIGDRLRTVLRTTADWYFRVAGLLAIVGLVALFRGRRPDRIFVLGVMLTLLLVPLALWGNPRFHVPLLPFVALAAAVPLAGLWRQVEARRAA